MPKPNDASSRTPFPAPIGYVLLWFPLFSETFIFREVTDLRKAGVPLNVYTLYGSRPSGQSKEMREFDGPVRHMGLRMFPKILKAFFKEALSRPRFVWQLSRKLLFRRMRSLESVLENTACFFSGFLLAEQAKADGLGLLHSPWANGPATAAMVASALTGIPFGFTGRAGDIYPEDGLLKEKSEAARFIRANNGANVPRLESFCPETERGKVNLVYNALTLVERVRCECNCTPPYKLLSIGRFTSKKGFPYLLTALARLVREGFPVHLTLVGDGYLKGSLRAMVRRLGLEKAVDMPGLVPHDGVNEFMRTCDVLLVPSIVNARGDRDGIPNVIMEALSNSVPVIATDVCGIREVIRDRETGLLVPEKNPAALARAIRQIVSDRAAGLSMARKGKELVLRMFDPAENTAKLASLYFEHCARPAGEGGSR